MGMFISMLGECLTEKGNSITAFSRNHSTIVTVAFVAALVIHIASITACITVGCTIGFVACPMPAFVILYGTMITSALTYHPLFFQMIENCCTA